MGRLGSVRRGPSSFLLIALAAGAAACGREEPRGLDPVRSIRSRVEPAFRAPADGRLTDAQLDAYAKVRRAMRGATSGADAARAVGVDPAEFDWIRARIFEALGVLDSRRVGESALESYGRAIASLRAAREAAADPKTGARIDAEIAAFERERAALRRPDPVAPAALANAARVEARRGEIEALGP